MLSLPGAVRRLSRAGLSPGHNSPATAYQLPYVLLNGVRVHEHSDCNQGVQGEVENLVAEERDDPGRALLSTRRQKVRASAATEQAVTAFRDLILP